MTDIAIFDLDYTLTKRGTWARFLIGCIKFRPHLWVPVIWAAGWTQLKYKRGYVPRIAVKTAMMRWSIVGKERAWLQAKADAFADNEVKKGLRPGAVAAMAHHKAKGDMMIMASAAVDIVAEAISERLGFDGCVSTQMGWDIGNCLSPRFASENCYGPEKLVRVKAFFAAQNIMKHNHTNITMYSDSYSDLDILKFADVGVAVNPDTRLRQEAAQHALRIEDWSAESKT